MLQVKYVWPFCYRQGLKGWLKKDFAKYFMVHVVLKTNANAETSMSKMMFLTVFV